MKNTINGKVYYGILAVLTLFKLWLCTGIPIIVNEYFVYDDTWCMRGAISVRLGQWMGSYCRSTLSKGSFFSIFLSAVNALGVPYILMLNVLYILSVILLVYVIKRIVPNRIILMIIYAVMLFNPATVCVDGAQRVYRNSITQFEVVFIITCMLGMYLARNDKPRKMLFWASGAGVAFGTFWLTREDSIWVVPYIGAAIMITVIMLFADVRKKKIRLKEFGTKIIICLMPFIMMFAGVEITRAINYHYYGVAYVNDSKDGKFPELFKALHSVKMDDQIEKVSISRHDLERLYDISPTLCSIKPMLDATLDNWDNNDGSPGDGEIEDGWFMWAFREAVEAAGYYTSPQTVDEFYTSIIDEINSAIENGEVEQNKWALSTSWISPWRPGYGEKLIDALKRTIRYTLDFQNMGVSIQASTTTASEGFIAEIENLTRNSAVHYDGEQSIHFNIGKINVLNKLTKPYQHIRYIVYLAVVLYILGIVWFVVMCVKKQVTEEYACTLLLLTGLFGSYMALCIGIAYTTISNFNAIGSIYLLGSYPIIILFTGVAILVLPYMVFIEGRNNEY